MRTVLIFVGALLAAAVQAQEPSFPHRGPIEITVLFPAGTSADVTARLLADGMSKQLGAKVIVFNRPGAGGAIGYKYVASQKPDGLPCAHSDSSSAVWAQPGHRPAASACRTAGAGRTSDAGGYLNRRSAARPCLGRRCGGSTAARVGHRAADGDARHSHRGSGVGERSRCGFRRRATTPARYCGRSAGSDLALRSSRLQPVAVSRVSAAGHEHTRLAHARARRRDPRRPRRRSGHRPAA